MYISAKNITICEKLKYKWHFIAILIMKNYEKL